MPSNFEITGHCQYIDTVCYDLFIVDSYSLFQKEVVMFNASMLYTTFGETYEAYKSHGIKRLHVDANYIRLIFHRLAFIVWVCSAYLFHVNLGLSFSVINATKPNQTVYELPIYGRVKYTCIYTYIIYINVVCVCV